MENDLKVDKVIEEENTQQDEAVLGTFKSVKNLKEAYDSLRKVFTKNAMELANLKKAKNSENDEKDDKNTQKSENIEQKSTKNASSEVGESDKVSAPDEQADKEKSPAKFWEVDSWNASVKDFFDSNNRARNYITEIGQVLISNKELENSKNPLEKAWIKVLEDKIDSNIVKNEDLERIVLNNNELKQKIIQQYLNQLNKKESMPVVIDKSVSGVSGGAEVKRHATSIQEAKEMAIKIFK